MAQVARFFRSGCEIVFMNESARGEPINAAYQQEFHRTTTASAHIPNPSRCSQNVPVTVMRCRSDRRARECTFRRIRAKCGRKCNCAAALRIRHEGRLTFPHAGMQRKRKASGKKKENSITKTNVETKPKPNPNRIGIGIRKHLSHGLRSFSTIYSQT